MGVLNNNRGLGLLASYRYPISAQPLVCTRYIIQAPETLGSLKCSSCIPAGLHQVVSYTNADPNIYLLE